MLRFSRDPELNSEMMWMASKGVSLLTKREAEVLSFLMQAKSAKMIGRELSISHRTVEVHRAHILEKLGARNTLDLVRIVSILQSSIGSIKETSEFHEAEPSGQPRFPVHMRRSIRA